MALNYETTNWENGKTVLRAEHLRKIEKGITDIIAENDAIYKDEDTRKSNEKQRQEEHLRKMNEASETVSNIQKDYDSLQKIIIDENASANLQNQINQTNSQLEQKMNIGGKITIHQIDKNKGKIDQTYLSDELLEQIAGDTPINSIVTDNSITISKLAFDPVLSSSTKNLFNKYRCKYGYYILDTDGVLYESDAFATSDYIEVTPGDILTKNTYNMGAFYDSNKTYISGIANGINTFEVPNNAVYFRYCIPTTEVDFAMLVVGDTVPSASTNYIEPIQINDNMIGDLALNKIVDYMDDNYIDPYGIRCWESIKVDGNTVNMFKKQVYQNPKNGKWFIVQSDEDMIFTINDGYTLTVSGEFNDVTLDSSAFKIVSVADALKDNTYPLITNISGALMSPIPWYQQYIYYFTYGTQDSNVTIINEQELATLSVNEKLSNLSPVFYEKYKKQEEDVTVVLIGDSISTTNYYTKSREDAKHRPPLMTEYAYPTFIEEQLRWDGQKYYRYDTGIFTEVASSKETLEYDLSNWDWSSNNYRPALTRVLTGDNCSVSFELPSDSLRCDFIYRTDKLNADSCTLSVSSGNNVLEVYNENNDSWTEANGFVYSAKEVDAEISTDLGLLNKSMYQKRLKIRVKGAVVPNTRITITNNGSGRLTYWGIQTSVRKVMFDFILSARGGHSIQRLEKFEEWDVDYYKPDLILWECPILNHNMDVCDSNFSPKDMGTHTTDNFSAPFIVKANELISKDYKPELISWIMWFGLGNNAINNENEWCYGICSNGERVSVPNYISKLDYLLRKNNINNLNLFNFYMDYAKKSSVKNNSNIISDSLSGSGINGETLTIDGGHFNTKGAAITSDIFGSFFIQ